MSDPRRQSTFDVFYINYNEDTDSYDSIVIEARPPIDELLTQFSIHFDNLINLDIQDFNFLIFSEDLERLSDNELEYFWVKFFENWLTLINEEYLYIDFDEIRTQFKNTNDKKLFIKKIVFFIMQLLPYHILTNAFYILDIDSEEKAYSWVNKFDKGKKEFLLQQFDNYMNNFRNLKESFQNLEKYIKKNFKDHIFIDERIDQNLKILEIFKSYINMSDYDQLKNLLKAYIETDADNLIA